MKLNLSHGAGLAFAAGFKALKVLRPDRPIHPSGVALAGTIERQGGGSASGIGWIDSAGTDPVRARLSRSLGTPQGWPDIVGLALRISTETGPADVLLASTLLRWPGRLLLIPQRHASSSNLTSLMPYKGADGPVLLAARTEPPAPRLPAAPDGFREALASGTWTLGLYHSRPTGRWHRFGTLTLVLDPDEADTAMRFDPLVHTLPGAGNYRWAARLREPSYSAARKPRA
ncbi:hypothetical protein QFZ65_001988 [Arthrobacter sp. B3I9]|uniref:hypothetical protein n=1 Tax=Arthrobacter sp. B3I9 TaxID=3042270 RepID=UPI002791905D|nr:hypothetical protein [Arthrobacter sp. B3I9]MDQ0850050.1 hypothetical protein [Arthrobacter sp. B3I9]